MVEEGSVDADVRLVWAADTVIAEGLMTWLDKVAMVPSVVMGVTREALDVSTVAPARLVETVPVTVPRVVTPAKEGCQIVRTCLKKEKKKKHTHTL